MKKSFLLFFLVFLVGCALWQKDPMDSFSSYQPFDTYQQAMTHYERGQYEKAKTLFHQYIAEEQQGSLTHIALYYLAYCYQMTKDIKQAEILYHRVRDEAKDDVFWSDMASERIAQIKAMTLIKQ